MLEAFGVFWFPIMSVYSFFPQTLQGADILAKAVGAQVFVPDFFGEGNAPSMDRFPPKSDEDRKYIQEFLEGPANVPATAAKTIAFANVLKSAGFKKIGALGYCFGNALGLPRKGGVGRF